ncbi:MAG: sigma-54 dependent transcriptional regulator [Deltaproteobacteria bacterium]|nr:sigma-54 dependent transcriptional regulator [Deltaproteobacteria bacterium]
MARTRLLVVDSDRTTAAGVTRALGEAVVDVVELEDWVAALASMVEARDHGAAFDLILVERSLVGAHDIGTELAARKLRPEVVLLTGDPRSIVDSSGIYDIIVKPASRGELKARIDRAVRGSQLDSLPGGAARKPRKSDLIIGGGPWVKDLYDKLAMAAPTDVTIAIYGESGTGKELVARTVHALSNRYQGPFVVVNCAAIPEALLEDELFGHVRGAFTDAARDREGLFSAADGGTIFLDEIGELPLSLQAKLLRVLQSQEFRRIGDDSTQKVDVRVLAATNRDLEAQVERGAFREDLYYRINVFPIQLPRLADRREDIPLLADHFLRIHRKNLGKQVGGFSPEAMAQLSSYRFPGNVRELDNRIHRALVMATGELVEIGDLQLETLPSSSSQEIDIGRPFRDLKREAVGRFEREYLEKLLTAHRGNVAAAARAADIDRKNLWSLAKKHGVDIDRFRR